MARDWGLRVHGSEWGHVPGARRRAAARRAAVGVATLVGSAVDKRPRRSGANSWDETLADRVRVALTMGFGDLATGLEIRDGRFESATVRESVNRSYDTLVLESARKWRYVPATLNGAPVKFRKMVGISISAAR